MFQHRFKYGFIAFITIYSFLNIIILNGDRLYKANLPAEYLLVVTSFLCLSLWWINILVEKHLVPVFVNVHPLISQFILSTIGLCLLALVSVELTAVTLGSPFTFTFKNLTLTSAFLFRVNLFLNTINAVVFFNQKFKEKELETEKMHNASLKARYEALNNQINPHFLFNSLNSLSSLIHIDVNKSEIFIEKLSEIYRYLIRNTESELVELREELSFLESYAELMSIRFDQALKFEIDIDKNLLGFHLPPTVLQLLIENVIKHNYFTESEPVLISIQSSEETIKVINTKRLKPINDTSSGIGLRNISERYEFFGKLIKVAEDDLTFSVSIPLIKLNSNESSNSRRRTISHKKASQLTKK